MHIPNPDPAPEIRTGIWNTMVETFFLWKSLACISAIFVFFTEVSLLETKANKLAFLTAFNIKFFSKSILVRFKPKLLTSVQRTRLIAKALMHNWFFLLIFYVHIVAAKCNPFNNVRKLHKETQRINFGLQMENSLYYVKFFWYKGVPN